MIQEHTAEDIEGDNSSPPRRADAHRAQEDYEEEVFGTQHPTKTSQFVQILEADLVRGGGQVSKSLLGVSTSPSE